MHRQGQGAGALRVRGEGLPRATTNAAAPGGQFVLGARPLPGNPYDGHTLAAGIAQTERITGNLRLLRAWLARLLALLLSLLAGTHSTGAAQPARPLPP